MIIKSIDIKNFRSYYGENHVDFSDGLTLIIGGNGDGKTTFYEAIEWLLNTAIEDKRATNISEKRRSEMEVGESDEVMVSIRFEHEGEKELTKRFRFEIEENNSVSVKGFEFKGFVSDGVERYQRQGSQMLDEIFEPEIRRYCMFKGESELNIFGKDENAIKKLVETFSDIKQFDKLTENCEICETKSQNAYSKELSSDKKNATRAKDLELKMKNANDKIKNIQQEIAEKESAISTYNTVIAGIETMQETSERWQDIKKRIEALEEERDRIKRMTVVDFNTKLLDDFWILRPFSSVLSQYQKKISNFELERRRQNRQFENEKARQSAQKQIIEDIQKLARGVTPLPWNLPDKETMEEMINDQVCKVCGREAPKGSEAYDFMVKKLNEYLNHIEQQKRIVIEQKEIAEQKLFVNNYIGELNTRRIKMSGEEEAWVAGFNSKIYEEIQFIDDRKAQLEQIINKLTDANNDRDNLLSQTPGLTAEFLDKSLKDYRGNWQAKEQATQRLTELKADLEKWNNTREDLLAEYNGIEPTNTMSKVYQNIHTIFQTVLNAVNNAKERNIDSFIKLLEKEANNYLSNLNIDDFYGIIRLKRKMNGSAEIELVSENGTIISNPNGALKTTMYMSVLFAISNITTKKRDNDYPLIFDAPTSSFENSKEDIFYNVIDKIDKQCIIVTKDLLVMGANGTKKLNEDKINQLSCSVYRISKAPGFKDKDLSTIQTIITKIK